MKTVAEVLSPPRGSKYGARRSGRVGFQLVGDTFSYGHNLPHRILLWDALDNLPEVLLGVMQDPSVQNVLYSQSNHKLSKPEIDSLRGFELSDVESFVGITVDHLSQAFAVANSTARNTSADTELSRSCDRAPRVWWIFLLVARPHIERQIWLTELSFAHPFHALCRFHDTWSILELFWYFSNRKELVENLNTVVPFVEGLPMCTIATRHLSADMPFCGEDKTYIVAGPMMDPQIVEGSPQSIRSENIAVAKVFLHLVSVLSRCCRGWENAADIRPTEEELLDALDSRLRIGASDLATRSKLLATSWSLLGSTQLESEVLKRFEWEGLASVVVFLTRNMRTLARGSRASQSYFPIAGNRLGLIVSSVDSASELDVQETNSQPPDLPCERDNLLDTRVVDRDLSWGQRVSETDRKLESLFTVDSDTINPVALYNRMRERRSGYWNFQVLSLNNMLQRSNARLIRMPDFSSVSNVISRAETNSSTAQELRDLPEMLLLGFGSRLCHHLVDLAQAHLCTIYWIDYSLDPAEVLPIGTYSRNAQLRAAANEIFQQFSSSFSAKPGMASRQSSPSLLYRVAAKNAPEIVSDNSQLVLDGYPEELVPRSAIAVPLRYNGRVVGVLELEGLAENQFSGGLLAPLTRAANVIGPFIYHNQLIWQLNAINQLVSANSKTQWAQRPINPLGEIAKILCNVFLCPVVNLWIKGYDAQRFSALGMSRTSIFEKDLVEEGISPSTTVDLNLEEYSEELPFANLGIALWKNQEPAWGRFVKGRYIDGDPPSPNSLVDAIEQAQKFGVNLYGSFANERKGFHEFRQNIFLRDELHGMMSFPIVRERKSLSSSTSGSQQEFVIEGFLTLHDHGDNSLEQYGYSLGWAPVVAHLQSYLPHIFDQIELINDGWSQTRNILAHETANVVESVADHVRKVSAQSHDLFHGEPRSLLRQWIQDLPDQPDRLAEVVISGSKAIKLRADLERIQRSILARVSSSDFLDDMAKRLNRLENRIRSHRAFQILDLVQGERLEHINVGHDLRERVKAFRKSTKANGLRVSMRVDDSITVEIERSLWERIMMNVFSNLRKYSEVRTEIKISTKNQSLSFSNVALLYPEDTVERLIAHGERGKNTALMNGDGTGLFMIMAACKLAQIGLDIHIEDEEPASVSSSRGQLKEFRMTFHLGSIAVSKSRLRGLH